MNIRIAIADDHPMIIQGLQKILLHYPFISLIGTYLNGVQLLDGLQLELPDILLLDIQLPGKTGDELAPIILKKYPGIKIIILTNFDSTLYIHNMLKYGVNGYLLKTSEQEALIDAITKVYNGEEYIEISLKEKMKDEVSLVHRSVSTKTKLTTREKEILQLIVDGNTDAEIAKKIFLSHNTVKHYRMSILLKMDVKNAATLVKKALLLGLAQ